MTRLFPTRVVTLLSATLCLQCSGQSVEGLWIGGFPGSDSQVCQIRLKDDNRFSVTCSDTRLMSVGRYHWNGTVLELQTEMLSLDRTLVPAKPTYRLNVVGHGNRMDVATTDRAYTWRRKPI